MNHTGLDMFKDYWFASFRSSVDGVKKPVRAYKIPTWVAKLVRRHSRNRYVCPNEVRRIVDTWIDKHEVKGIYPRMIEKALKKELGLHDVRYGKTIEGKENKSPCQECFLSPETYKRLMFLFSGGYCFLCGKEEALPKDDFLWRSANCQRVKPNRLDVLYKVHSNCFDIADDYLTSSKTYIKARRLISMDKHDEAALVIVSNYLQRLACLNKNDRRKKPRTKENEENISRS